MEREEALALAAEIYAAFPGRSVSVTTIELAARELLGMGEDAHAVAARAIRDFRSPPSIADLHDLWREVRREYAQLALPASQQTEEGIEMPAEVREQLERLRQASAAAEPERDWAEVKRATLARARLARVCPAVGQPPRIVDGHALCPRCGIDIDPDCPPQIGAACDTDAVPSGHAEDGGEITVADEYAETEWSGL